MKKGKITSSNIFAYRSTIKSKNDNETFVFVFEDIKPICISNTILSQTMEIDGKKYTYKEKFIDPLFTKNKFLYTLYKNKQGVWINYSDILSKFPSAASYIDIANNQDFYPEFSISPYFVPEVDFVDSDGIVHYIEKCDGLDSFETVSPLYIDEREGTKGLKIEQCSLDNLDLDFSLRHLMMDLKVTILDTNFSISNTLVWMNGVFVKIINDTNSDKIFYIENAKSLMTSSSYFNDENGNPIYTYDIDIRFFKWKNVNMSDVISASSYLQDSLIAQNKSFDYISSIIFSEEINKDAHFITCDGRILNNTDYEIDKDNPKQINLINIRFELDLLLKEILLDTTNESSGESNYNPTSFFNDYSLSKNFGLINLSHSDSSKKIFTQKVKPVAIDYPLVNNIMFRECGYNDMVLVEGFYVPYLIKKHGIYEYPRFLHTYIDQNVNLTRINDIYKIIIKELY